jgi:hypothetical protein
MHSIYKLYLKYHICQYIVPSSITFLLCDYYGRIVTIDIPQRIADRFREEYWCQTPIFRGESCFEGRGMQIFGEKLEMKAQGSDILVSGTNIQGHEKNSLQCKEFYI